MPNLSEQLLDVDLLHGRRDLGFRIEQFDGHFDVVATKNNKFHLQLEYYGTIFSEHTLAIFKTKKNKDCHIYRNRVRYSKNSCCFS